MGTDASDRAEPSPRLELFVEHASELVIELGSGGRVLYVSPSVREILGYTPEDFCAMSAMDLVHPDDRSAALADYAGVLQGEGVAHSIHRGRHRDGSWRWMHDIVRSCRGDDGQLRLLVMARDITEHKRLEHELEQQLSVQGRIADLSRYFLSLACQQIDDGIRRHLSTAADLAGADRVRLVVTDLAPESLLGTYDWCAPGIAQDGSQVDASLIRRFAWLSRKLERGEVVEAPVVEALPEAARAEREALRSRGVQSLLVIPLRSGASVIGHQVFECVRAPRSWTPRQISQVRLVGEIFASAVRRRHAEESLRVSEERFRAIAEHAGELVLEADRRGRFCYVSPSAERLLGHAPARLIGQRLVGHLHPEDARALRDVYQDALSSQSDLRVVHRMRHEDGSWRWFESSGRGYRSVEGGLRFLSIGRDITERIEAERALERQLAAEKRVADLSRRFLALDPEATDAAVREALGEAAELAGADRSFLRVTGLEGGDRRASFEWCAEGIAAAEDAQPRSFTAEQLARGRMVHCTSLDALPDAAAPDRRALADRGVHSLLWIPLRSDKRTIGTIGFEVLRAQRGPIDVEATPLRLIGEILVSALRRKRTETALRDSESLLAQAHKLEAVGRLAGGIAHDFNNLLTVILGFSRPLLRELAADDPVREDLVEIHGAAERAAGLTRQLLTFSRRQVVQPQVIDLNDTLVGLESMLARLLGEDVELVLDLAPELGGVVGDAHQFEQVVVNLAANARDAMPDGGTLQLATRDREVGAVEARRFGLQGPGSYVLLTVTDSGHGIDEQTRRQIFDPFFTTKDPGKGTGLGLSVAYSIVQAANGTIRVEGRPAKGTTFEIWLPLAAPEVHEQVVDESRPGPCGSGRVLLVEDEASVRRLTERILERSGYEVLTAVDGLDALEVLARDPAPIQALVTDVVMPRLGGVDLARRLRAVAPELAVLFISGYPDRRDRSSDALPPGTRLLQKPFSADALLANLKDAFDGRPD
jgi:PAS domain S-box-containing protein